MSCRKRISLSQGYIRLTPQCVYWKVSDTVFVSWQGVGSLRQGWNTVGTLPEGYRPTVGKTEGGTLRASAPIAKLGSSATGGTIDAFSNGDLRVWSPSASTSQDPSSAILFFWAGPVAS